MEAKVKVNYLIRKVSEDEIEILNKIYLPENYTSTSTMQNFKEQVSNFEGDFLSSNVKSDELFLNKLYFLSGDFTYVIETFYNYQSGYWDCNLHGESKLVQLIEVG